jgi:tetratricopeptide (TPR) repeat protein
MPGELDVYQLCPCGSGKKIKFCCHAIVSEMLKVADLQQSHQHQPALTLLATVEKKVQPRDVWSRAWVKTTQAFLLFGMGTVEEARQLVDEVLEELPEHPLAVVVNGVLSATTEGYPACMRAAYRAFEYGSAAQPYLVSHLAMILAQLMSSKGHFFAAGQNLALAVRFDPENEEAGKQYIDFIREVQISYPVRDGYGLVGMRDDDPLKPQFDQARKLAERGRFSDAAKAFGMVARQAPKRSALWWNIAICHAAAAEDPLAVEALKAAAANEPDFETEVDCLVLSRQLRPPADSAKIKQLGAKFAVESVSKLLTALDQQPHYVRVETPEETGDEPGLPRTAAVYRILDRDPSLVPTSELSPGNVAHVLGDLAIFDRVEADPARAFISGLGPERLATMTADFAKVAGDLARAEGESFEHGYVRAEHAAMAQNWYIPADIPRPQLHALLKTLHRHIVEEVWPTTPQEALGGKTPLEAAPVPEMKAALAAAIVDFDVFCEKSGIALDQDALRSRLGLPAVVATQAIEGAIGVSMSLLGLRHRDLTVLRDQELAIAANHVMRLGHATLSCAVLAEALRRPGLQDKLDVPKLSMYLSRIYAQRQDFDAALHWVTRGKEAVKARKQPLTDQALWELHELMIRSQRPDDSQLIPIANTLWTYYIPKLPEVREMIVSVLHELEIPGPWKDSLQLVQPNEPVAAVGVGSSSWWTPEGGAARQPSKLWLPGQQ